MSDPLTLTSLLLAGAATLGTEAVKEGTKDAYRKLKDVVGEVFGPKATKALVKVEDAGTVEEGRQELERYVGGDLDVEDATRLEPHVAALVNALKQDPPAAQAANSRIGLDLDVGGDALLRKIHGAREMAVRATTKGNFTLEDVVMDNGRNDRGN